MFKKSYVVSEVTLGQLLKGKLENAGLQYFNATHFVALDGHGYLRSVSKVVFIYGILVLSEDRIFFLVLSKNNFGIHYVFHG